jgi:hypothetical protein
MPTVEAERARREAMWANLRGAGDPGRLSPQLLRELGVYGGAQGIWVDTERTRGIDGAGGITVSLLHTGRHYSDELSADGVLYHYPRTGRPPGRDRSEVEATKVAGRLRLPVLSLHQVVRLQAAMSTRAGSKAGTMKPSSSWSPLLRILQPGHQAMLANRHLCWRARSPGLVALSLLGRTSSDSSLQSSSCMARSVRSATSRSPTCCKLLIFEARPRAAQTILATALCCVPCITWLMTEACLPLSQPRWSCVPSRPARILRRCVLAAGLSSTFPRSRT